MIDVNRIQAVFWDFDGVILDTEPLHHAAFNDVLIPLGARLSWDVYQSEYIGYDDRDALNHASRSHQLELDEKRLKQLLQSKASAFQNQLEKASKEPYPGVMELLSLWQGKIPQLICSGALMCDIDPVLDDLNIRGSFLGFVTADRVAKSKPYPETYEKGFELALSANPGLEKSACLAIEDTPAGISAAKGAGLPVLAVTNTHPKEDLSEADWVVDSLLTLLDS